MLQALLIQEWSTGIWVDLGQPTNTTPSTISGYAIQPSTLGKLNNLLSTCFSGSGYTGGASVNYQIGPFVTNTELAVIEALYLVSYYNNLAQATMGIGGTTIPWTNIAEGDSKIGRANPANLGKEYREMAKDSQARLTYLANAYRAGSAGSSVARSVDYPDVTYIDGGGLWP